MKDAHAPSVTLADGASALLEEIGKPISGPDDPEIFHLAPPLRSSVCEIEGMPWIKHPWLNTPFPFVGQSNKVWNAKFSMMRRYLGERDLDAYLHVVIEKPWRFDVLARWWDRGNITIEELRDLLPGVWVSVEIPSNNEYDPLYLFEPAGFVTDDDEAWGALEDPIQVYRGGLMDGVSWTTSKTTAEFFARRFRPNNPQIWRAEITKSSALGFFTARGESEIVLDPYDLNPTRMS